MKDYCVIFDTNILTENKKILNEIKSKINCVADIYIPKIVIEEIQAQKSRSINEDYLKIKSIIDKNSDIFKYEEKFDLNNSIGNSESNIEKWFKKYCNDNIIDYDDITMTDVLSRLKYKKAPFINEVGSSDKGFKDSIIWISILKNKELQKYKKILFATNDKTGFIKRAKELYDEYNLEHLVPLVMCFDIEELYNNLGIIKLEKENDDSGNLQKEKVNIDNIDDLKEKLNTCVEKILYSCYEGDWGDVHCYENFNIYSKMKEEDIEYFLNLLDGFLKENIFFNMIDITTLLKRCGIDSSGENVSPDYLMQLNDIYKDLKNNKNLYNPFINFLKTEFNKLYKIKSKERIKDSDKHASLSDDDLPF